MKKFILASVSIFLIATSAQAQVSALPPQAQAQAQQQWQEAQAVTQSTPSTFGLHQQDPVAIPQQTQMVAPTQPATDSISLMQFNFGM